MKEIEIGKRGLVNRGITDAFKKLKAGETAILKLDIASLPSCRARAADLNMEVGYTRYSVSIDSFTETIRIKNND